MPGVQTPLISTRFHSGFSADQLQDRTDANLQKGKRGEVQYRTSSMSGATQ